MSALAGYKATHFRWEAKGKVATITLDRPERKNPLTFESYAELRDLFGQLRYATDVHAVVVTGAGRGVGRAIALSCARTGAVIVCSAPNQAEIGG